MLSQFYITTEDFEHELRTCGSKLADWNNAHHIQRHRMSDLGQDMLSFRGSLVRAHINATMWAVDDADEASRGFREPMPNFEDLHAYLSGTTTNLPQDTKEAVEAHLEAGRARLARMMRRSRSAAGTYAQQSVWELKAAYKAYFFFVRAFHDACYGVLLNANGAHPGSYSSMRRCLDKKVEPIYTSVASIPGYVDWFYSFKEKRDEVKRGANFSLVGPQWNVGVGFNRITPEGGLTTGTMTFRLGDLVSAFQYSTALITVIHRNIPANAV